MLYATLIIGLIFVPIGAFTKGSQPGVVIVMGAITLLTPLMLLLLRRRFVILTGVLLVSLFFIATIECVFIDGGICAPIAALFILCVVEAGLFFGNHGTVAATGLSLIALSVLWRAEAVGLLLPCRSAGFVALETHAGLLLGTAVLVIVFTRSLNHTLERAQCGEQTLTERNFQLEAEITERKQMEEELRKSRDELEQRVRERTEDLESSYDKLRMVPSLLIQAQETERHRLAVELHDSVGQTLAALKFRIEHVITTIEKRECAQGLQLLHRFVPILQRSMDETRAIYMGLKPIILSEQGILPTLEWYRREILELYPGQHIELEIAAREEDIPEDLKTAIFRIVQEALNNAFKHGKPEWVDVRLGVIDDAVELDISDDGIGMDLDCIMESPAINGLGLMGMRERAELTGGELTIRSAPNAGTTVKAVWRAARAR
jgi:signal transduction histidine kinase